MKAINLITLYGQQWQKAIFFQMKFISMEALPFFQMKFISMEARQRHRHIRNAIARLCEIWYTDIKTDKPPMKMAGPIIDLAQSHGHFIAFEFIEASLMVDSSWYLRGVLDRAENVAINVERGLK